MSLLTDIKYGTTILRHAGNYLPVETPKTCLLATFFIRMCSLRMLYVSLLWPCLLQTLGYLSSFFLAERKLRWPSLPLLLLSPLTPQLICPQVATESLFLSWATSSPPRSQLIVIRTAGPAHSGPSTAFLFRSLLTTLCQLHGFSKLFGQ